MGAECWSPHGRAERTGVSAVDEPTGVRLPERLYQAYAFDLDGKGGRNGDERDRGGQCRADGVVPMSHLGLPFDE